MCEDHQIPLRRGVTIRQGRIERIQRRLRSRRLQHLQQQGGAPLRENQPESDIEQLEVRPTSPTPAVNIPNFNNVSAQRYNEIFNTNDDRWYQFRTVQQTRRDNLVEIAMRTVMLMRQNRQLQEKLAILKADTKTYMEYMRNNQMHPEQETNMEDQLPDVKIEPNMPEAAIKIEN